MKIIPVECLPERQPKTLRKNINDIIEEFVRMNVKYARVEFGSLEYASVKSAHDAIKVHILYHPGGNDYPVKMKFINGDIYFIRTDMED